jgi:hypothetical protein
METRAKVALNLAQYSEVNEPVLVADNVLKECPHKRQYVLRMLIQEPFSGFQIPEELEWTRSLVELSARHQEEFLKVRQPFCYITVRHGLVESVRDEEWHVDGFSMNITHLPEQNYVATSCYPTEYFEGPFPIPSDFDPFRHNIHTLFQSQIKEKERALREVKPRFKPRTLKSGSLWAIDPYIVHRRPKVPVGVVRTFVRVSFTPIEISDKNNTQNYLIPRNYQRDGVKDFRDKLIDYKPTWQSSLMSLKNALAEVN